MIPSLHVFQSSRGHRNTVFTWKCFGQDSLLVRLIPDRQERQQEKQKDRKLNGSYGIHMAEEMPLETEPDTEVFLPPPSRVIPGEDNVLVMDMAQWRTDDSPWQAREEMLRIGIAAKEQLHISTAAVTGAQPWILPEEEAEHTLSLRLAFTSDISLPSARLALEDSGVSQVLFNGVPVTSPQEGYFTDEAIACFRVGPIKQGVNTVEVVKPLTARTCTENLFLLGDFGVAVRGTETRITAKPDTPAYGDLTRQGYPFYSGPITYRYILKGGQGLRLKLGRFSAPCVTAELDGKRIANLSLSPSECDLGCLEEGEHTLDITVYLSRINSFGTFHLNDPTVIWFGPQAWRSTGMQWSYTYRLAPSGLLSEPHLFISPSPEKHTES